MKEEAEPEMVHANNPEEYQGNCKTAPDLTHGSAQYPQKEWSAGSIVAWSIDNKNQTAIQLMLEQMVTCYKTYVAANSSPVDSVNMLIIGFEGRLKQWLALLQKKKPDLLTEWAKTVVLNEQGQPQLLENGSQENNYIGKLISAIIHKFIGQYIDTTQIQTMALTQTRLKRMTEFHAYFEEYQRRLFLLPFALAPSWKLHFISTLPK